MSRIVNVSQSNYKLLVETGGTITFDTGGTGSVFIDGDLTVTGQTTNINSVNTNIEDNIIILNKGETTSVVSEGSSGIQIDRGSSVNPQFLFDESVSWWDPQTSTLISGGFVTKNEDDSYLGLRTVSINSGIYDLVLIGAGDGQSTSLVTVNGTIDYEDRVLDYTKPGFPAIDDDIIPNIKSVIDYVIEHIPVKIQDQSYNPDGSVNLSDSLLQIYDTDILGSEISRLELTIDGDINAEWYADRHEVQDIVISDDNISTMSSDFLVLTSNNDNVEIDGVLNLTNQVSVPDLLTNKTRIYTNSVAATPGKSGIFFVNDISSDELIAKNRALLFSMLF